MFAKKLIVPVMLLLSLLGLIVTRNDIKDDTITKDNATELEIESPKVPLTIPELVDKYSKEYGVSATTMNAIIKCESQAYTKAVNENFRKDGTVWSRDWGSFQLNDYYHKTNAEKMGLSIYDTEDNIHYGAYLLKTKGVAPWKASAACWKSKI